MSYQEKRTMLTIFTSLTLFTIYATFAITTYRNQINITNDLSYWARLILIFIGIGIVAAILLQILFHIGYSILVAIKEKAANPDIDDKDIERIIKSQMVTDEMDKLVELKSMRIGFISAGIGFMFALISILLNYSPVIMINIIFISFHLGSIFEGVTQLYYYKRGIKHG
ncbi:MAG: hypothetical protein NUK62_04325 [Tenericutes bacterium]|nr:hypothetical protein [Mycoplasmatota bacterium]